MKKQKTSVKPTKPQYYKIGTCPHCGAPVLVKDVEEFYKYCELNSQQPSKHSYTEEDGTTSTYTLTTTVAGLCNPIIYTCDCRLWSRQPILQAPWYKTPFGPNEPYYPDQPVVPYKPYEPNTPYIGDPIPNPVTNPPFIW